MRLFLIEERQIPTLDRRKECNYFSKHIFPNLDAVLLSLSSYMSITTFATGLDEVLFGKFSAALWLIGPIVARITFARAKYQLRG